MTGIYDFARMKWLTMEEAKARQDYYRYLEEHIGFAYLGGRIDRSKEILEIVEKYNYIL